MCLSKHNQKQGDIQHKKSLCFAALMTKETLMLMDSKTDTNICSKASAKKHQLNLKLLLLCPSKIFAIPTVITNFHGHMTWMMSAVLCVEG